LSRIPLTLEDLAGVATSEVQKLGSRQLQVAIVITFKPELNKRMSDLACGGPELMKGIDSAELHSN